MREEINIHCKSNKKYNDPLDLDIKCCHQLFEEYVRKTPNAIALVYKNERITYKSLDDKANKLAYELKMNGVKREKCVAILCKRSIEMIVAILAISKSGAAFVLIDNTLPFERINYMVRDADVDLVLYYGINNELLSSVMEIGVEIWDLSKVNTWNNKCVVDNVNNPNDLLCVIYTSGTTGEAKGVMIEHNMVYALKMEYKNNIGLLANDKILQFASCTFSMFLAELSMSLLIGAQLHIIDEKMRHDISALEKYINENNITHVMLPPAYCAQIDLKTVKKIIVGGSATNSNMLRKNQSASKYTNAYGTTECAMTTNWTYDNSEEIPEIIPIGKPVWGKEVYIINEGKVCEVNQIGEICVTGLGIARGYKNKREISDEKFTSNPYGKGKMYHTGDLGRWLADGNIEYLGRIDDQIKSSSYRIEPIEIEKIFRKYSGIKEVVIFTRKIEDNEIICALFTALNEINISKLVEFISIHLPHYMIPAYIEQIEQIPRTINGKVDKKSLLEVIENRNENISENMSEDETMIVNIFKDILKLNQIKVDDNFFHIGGNSLGALMVLNRIEKNTGSRLTIGEFFNNNTPKKLAKQICKEEDINSNVDRKKKEIYLMSPTQKRMYIVNEMENIGLAYNNPICFKVPKTVQNEKLYETFEKIIKRNEIFRTIFFVEYGEYKQKIEKYQDIDFEYKKFDKSIYDVLYGVVNPFVLNRGPLLRMKVLECIDGKYLFFDFHHIIFDGLSKEIFLNEFSRLYNNEELEEQNFQFADYSEWINTKDLSKQKEYWLSQFKDNLSNASMLCDFQRPSRKTYNGNRIGLYLVTELKNKIKDLAKNTGTTESMLFLSCVMILMSKYSNQENVIIGMPISGRTNKETEGIIGMFVNTLAFKGKPKKNSKFSEFLNEIKSTAIKSYENQDYPFEELVEEVETTRDFSRNPLFDIMFVMQNMEHQALVLQGKECNEMIIEGNCSKFDLVFQIDNICDELKIEIEYCTDLFKVESVNNILNHYIEILRKIANNPEIRIGEIEVATEEEKNVIMKEFNNTEADYPRDKTVADLFEEQVSKTPNNTAVIFENESITYRELNLRSNMLAYKLRKLGLGRDDYVAIIAERSIEMIVGIYGVLKAGGAYVPIDPTYPKERIQYMLNDCKPKAILIYKSEIDTNIPVINLAENDILEGEYVNLPKVNKPEDLAYLIYTSGTTGNPKGVMVENRNVVRLIKNTKFKFDFNNKDVWMLFHSFCFDFSVWEIFGSTLYGSTLVVISKEDSQDAFRIAKIIEEKKVTVLNQVPSAFYNLMQIESKQMESVRYLIFGGEALRPDKLKSWYERYPQAKIINMYGITETTVHATYREISELEVQKSISDIGKAIPTLNVYVMNKDILCGIGMPGELCVTGEGLARGYLNNPELTENKFVKNPFGEGRMYRTGDLGRWLPDGNIEYLGRIDEQVKIRGFRIELGEIESVIRKQEGVRDAVVITREKNEEKYLCAYLVAEVELDMKRLRNEIKKELPGYMIPTYQMQIDKFPITKNGKLDKEALPEIKVEIVSSNYVAPRNNMEEKISEIFRKVLGLERVSVEDSFFDIGGDSMKAMRLVIEINSIGLNITVRDIMKKGTIEKIVEKISKEKEI